MMKASFFPILLIVSFIISHGTSFVLPHIRSAVPGPSTKGIGVLPDSISSGLLDLPHTTRATSLSEIMSSLQHSTSLPSFLASFSSSWNMNNNIDNNINDININNPIWTAIVSEERPFQYWFMLPTMACIATSCQLAGIGGAALLSPLLLLVFPLLGPDYPLSSAASAIASALLTEVFGFASGLYGYWNRGLVDWTVAGQYLVISIPMAFSGALLASTVAAYPTALRTIYAILMIGLSVYLTISESSDDIATTTTTDMECIVLLGDDDDDDDDFDDSPQLQQSLSIRTKKAADGTVYQYLMPDMRSQGPAVVVATGSGALLTGLLGVGIGEVVLPQLVRLGCMGLPVAAGTSVAVVVVTALTSAVVQFSHLAQDVVVLSASAAASSSTTTTEDVTLFQALVQVVPWSLVQFTIPGALLGGQLAPFIASQKIVDDEVIEQFTAALFGIIGVAFAVKCILG